MSTAQAWPPYELIVVADGDTDGSWRVAIVEPRSASCGGCSSISRGHSTVEDSQKTLEEIVLTRLLRLNANVHGVVTGIVAGLGVFIATNWLVLKGGRVVGPHLSLLSQFFMGYRVTFIGSLIGFVYAFAFGYIGGYVVARMYNWLVDIKERKRPART